MRIQPNRRRALRPCTRVSPRAFAVLLLAWLSVQPGEVFSQNLAPANADLRGVLKSELAVNLSVDGLQKADIEFEPELTFDLGDSIRVTAIGRLRFDPVDKLEPGAPPGQAQSRSVVSRRWFVGDRGDFELREFYADASIGAAFLRLGKQQVVWGQADGLRVLDVVNPLNFREFILPEFEDRRIPLWMANVEAPIGGATVQFLWIPDHTFNETPEPGAVYGLSSPRFVPRPPTGFAGAVTFASPNRPDRLIRDDDYGVRLSGFSGGWDWSINYLFHYGDSPAPARNVLDNGDIEIARAFRRGHLVGGSASNAFGKFTLRAEAGYETAKQYLTSGLRDADGVFATGEFAYVLGLDYQHDADTILSAQLFQSALAHVPAGATRDRLDTTFSFLARREFRNDTIDAEVLYLHNVNDGDGLVQVEFSYDLTGDTRLTAGADLFFGNRDGVFGQFDKADRLVFGIERGF